MSKESVTSVVRIEVMRGQQVEENISLSSISCYHGPGFTPPPLLSLLPGSLCNWFSIDREVFINILQERWGEVFLVLSFRINIKQRILNERLSDLIFSIKNH